MTKRSKLALNLAAALAAVIVLPAAEAHAATLIFSNIGLHKTWDSNNYDSVNGAAGFGGDTTHYLASSFTTPGNGIFFDYLDIVVASVQCGGSLSRGVSVDLVADDGGKPSETGGVIQHWLIAKVPDRCVAVKPTKLSIPSAQQLILTANTTYWVVLTPVGLDDHVRWFDGSTNNGSGTASGDAGQTWVPYNNETEPYSLDVWRR
jgi:hypothetical protein